MRIVKEMLLGMLPGVKIFLDVDNLVEGRGAESVDEASVTLIFCSDGYFRSRNCMRELLRAIFKRKPMIALLESDPKHGKLTRRDVEDRLNEIFTNASCTGGDPREDGRPFPWGLGKEIEDWDPCFCPTAQQAPELPLTSRRGSASYIFQENYEDSSRN